MKVLSSKTLTSGDKNGRKWYLCAVTFEGAGEAKGFLSFEPQADKELDVEFFYKEYKGIMEKNFKLKPKAAGTDPQTTNRIIQIESYVVANNTMLKGICKHLGVSTMGNVGNTSVPYPDAPVDVFTKAEMDGRDIPDLTDNEVPF